MVDGSRDGAALFEGSAGRAAADLLTVQTKTIGPYPNAVGGEIILAAARRLFLDTIGFLQRAVGKNTFASANMTNTGRREITERRLHIVLRDTSRLVLAGEIGHARESCVRRLGLRKRGAGSTHANQS